MALDILKLRTLQPPDGLGFKIRRLGHVVLQVSDMERSLLFYTQVLGFKVTEIYSEDLQPGGFAFLRCHTDHHSIALVGNGAARSQHKELHHVAFEVASVEEVFAVRERLREQGATITFEGRRRAGCQIAVEFLDPDGHCLEIYWGLDQIGTSGYVRPSSEWKGIRTLEAAVADPRGGPGDRHSEMTSLPERSLVTMMEQKKDRRAVGVKVLPEGVEEYCERHTTALTELHEELLRETEEKTTTANFLVGELEGAFLKMIVRMTQAKRILEVGMFTGYSALSFAEALPADGQIITCEIDPHVIGIAERFFSQSPHAKKIEIKKGPATESLKTIAGPFDLCFIDADKPGYDYYYDRCVDLVRQGGLVILDNMLRYGRVLNPTEEDARIVNALNDRIHNDPRVENVLLPFRDGIMLAYKL